MSILQTTTIKHPSSTANNITLYSDGTISFKDSNGYVLKSGDTMSGSLTLPTQTAGTRNNTAATMDMFNQEFISYYNAIGPGSQGYQKLPSGIIIQWGYNTPAGVGSQYIGFPISFNLSCQVSITNAMTTSPVALYYSTGNWTLSAIDAFNYNGSGVWSFAWIAICK